MVRVGVWHARLRKMLVREVRMVRVVGVWRMRVRRMRVNVVRVRAVPVPVRRVLVRAVVVHWGGRKLPHAFRKRVSGGRRPSEAGGKPVFRVLFCAAGKRSVGESLGRLASIKLSTAISPISKTWTSRDPIGVIKHDKHNCFF